MKNFKSFILEHDGPTVWTDGKNRIEKISDTEYKVYHGDEKEESYSSLEDAKSSVMKESSPAWQRKEGKSESGGLNRKGIESYRRENPGSKLSMAVTTKPSKLKAGSKAAKRRKSFCSRMSGMKRKLTSSKTANDPDSRINKALRKWNC